MGSIARFFCQRKKLFLVGDRDKFHMPELTWPELPDSILEAVRKQISEYWTPPNETDQGRTTGTAKPYLVRPQERHSLLLKDYR